MSVREGCPRANGPSLLARHDHEGPRARCDHRPIGV